MTDDRPHPDLVETSRRMIRIQTGTGLIRARLALAGIPEHRLDDAIAGYFAADAGAIVEGDDCSPQAAVMVGWAFRIGETHASRLIPELRVPEVRPDRPVGTEDE